MEDTILRYIRSLPEAKQNAFLLFFKARVIADSGKDDEAFTMLLESGITRSDMKNLYSKLWDDVFDLIPAKQIAMKLGDTIV